MGHWKSLTPLIIDDDELGVSRDGPFIVVDGGAAGTLFEPFSHVEQNVRRYTFEPRGPETVKGQAMHVNIDAGLWSATAVETLHVAAEPSTSSIYPPNMSLLARFPDRIGAPARKTVSEVDVRLTSIDDQTTSGAMPLPHFIKLDIHSAEYEALVGASNSLSECLGFLVETWHAPVHQGQHLNGEIEHFLFERGFQLYASFQQSQWRHARHSKTYALDRPQLIGSESLFIREDVPEHLELQHVALLELFGFSNRALQFIDQKGEKAWNRLGAAHEALRRNQKARWRRHGRVAVAGMLERLAGRLR